jgi:hypothetical protein
MVHSGVCFAVSPMSLARRMLRTVNRRSASELIDLLRAVSRSGAADMSLANGKQETVWSILGAPSAEQLEVQLSRIAELAQTQPLPLSIVRSSG